MAIIEDFLLPGFTANSKQNKNLYRRPLRLPWGKITI